MTDPATFPIIETVGLAGILVRFGSAMSEPANRAAIAFRAAVDDAAWPEVSETTISLVSAFVLVDLVEHDANLIIDRLRAMLDEQDWFAAPLPQGRTLWHVPTVYGTDLAPQLEEAASLAGLDPDAAIAQLSSARVRVLTIGFAPGQPYMGELPEIWNIPRQTGLTPQVPGGALVIAIQQLIIFTNPAPTGWRHIGQTAFENFRPDHDPPFALSIGDELTFPAIDRAEYDRIKASGGAINGGAEKELLA
jgi:KipI family sensor histidine kinase inhibitor